MLGEVVVGGWFDAVDDVGDLPLALEVGACLVDDLEVDDGHDVGADAVEVVADEVFGEAGAVEALGADAAVGVGHAAVSPDWSGVAVVVGCACS